MSAIAEWYLLPVDRIPAYGRLPAHQDILVAISIQGLRGILAVSRHPGRQG